MSIVTVHVACSSTTARSERRFDKGLLISELKGKLEMIIGASAGHMTLKLQDHNGADICEMADNDKMLGAYPVEDFMTIYVVDANPHSTASQFEDLSLVDKMEMPDEEYNKLSFTVRAYKERNKMGRFNPEIKAKMEETAAQKEVEGEEEAKSMSIGDRCEVTVGGVKRGEIMYIGKPEFQKGWWIGVKYDEPLGKNDGSVQGVRYFQCPPKYGAFVRPANVKVGDYPEEDLDFSSDDEM
eukprot:m.52711 g.52711  ORF g.52711 m.52711 type:complete len:240 (+) comp10812_c0_seq6:172-891(+)